MRSPLNSTDTLTIDGYIQKTELSGLTKWFRSYHINGYTLALKDITVLPNKQILAVGHTNEFGGSPNGNLKHGIILKTDSNGYIQWCRLYPRQRIYSAARRSDGNLAILASDSGGANSKNLKLALLQPSGNLIWCKRLMSPDSEFVGIRVKEGINKSFLINSNWSLLILLDSNGTHVNDLAYYNPSGAAKGFYNVINHNNQSYYVSGYNLSGSSQATLVSTITKTDASLNIVWHKNYQSSGGNSEFWNIMALSPNNFLVFCEPENYGYLPNIQRTGFAFFDSSGVFKKSHLFTSDSVPMLPQDLINLNNGKFLFSAWGGSRQYFGVADTLSGTFCKQTQISWSVVPAPSPINTNSFTCVNASFNYSNIPVYIYQPIDASIEYICSNGPTGPLDPTPTSIREEKEGFDINIFPIPSRDFVFIELNSMFEAGNYITLKLFNALGRQVLNNVIYRDGKFTPLDLRSFSDGVYYLTIKLNSGHLVTKKIILTKN